ncbi:magnesium transporter CorA family protein [Taibaiella koreensis]|uniref:magnesium transporter CorA family protein n=1 Tax=Taibaiella koreensis TaxID=1268548 RepID=UPI000E59CF73|nr:CorA family divalent cation transporter [Taibaiella koreensis]
MQQQIARRAEQGFDWIDITDPSKEELEEIARQYHLHPALVRDCLQPDHLPKYERMEDYAFIIFRIRVENDRQEADTVQELTDKIAVFYTPEYLITLHRQEHDLLTALKQVPGSQRCNTTAELLNMLVYACLGTYETSLTKLSREVDYYEEIVFLRPKKAPLLKGLYYLKRKIDLYKRMLILSSEIIDVIDGKDGDVITRDTRDQYEKLVHMFEALSENLHQLLNVYFSASSQKANDIIRVLTIFSVFFMPLTFIVGIYGMNFKYMPELNWAAGYPFAMGLMAVVTLIIYAWFRRKKWL